MSTQGCVRSQGFSAGVVYVVVETTHRNSEVGKDEEPRAKSHCQSRRITPVASGSYSLLLALCPFHPLENRTRLLTFISLVAGLALFVYLVKQAGPSEVLTRVRALGSGFFLILAISSLRYLVRTLAWMRCLKPEERDIGFGLLWRARLAGEAIGDLTTAGPLVAEPLKVIALGRKVSLASSISSLAVENLAYLISSCLMVMAGALLLLASFGLSQSLRVASLGALLAVLMVMVLTIVGVKRRWAVASSLAALASRLIKSGRFKQWLESRLDRVRELEAYVFDFHARRPGDFFIVALFELSFHIIGVVEIYLTLHLIGYAPAPALAFILESVNRVINIVFAFVPVMIGVDEAGTGLLTQTLGLGTAAGVTLAIIRKARMFVWIGLGLVFLASKEAAARERVKPESRV